MITFQSGFKEWTRPFSISVARALRRRYQGGPGQPSSSPRIARPSRPAFVTPVTRLLPVTLRNYWSNGPVIGHAETHQVCGRQREQWTPTAPGQDSVAEAEKAGNSSFGSGPTATCLGGQSMYLLPVERPVCDGAWVRNCPHCCYWPGSLASFSSVQFSSVTQSCPTVCDSMNHCTPGLHVHHQLPELTQTHVHRVSDAIQPSHPLSSPFPPAFNLSQHQALSPGGTQMPNVFPPVPDTCKANSNLCGFLLSVSFPLWKSTKVYVCVLVPSHAIYISNIFYKKNVISCWHPV